ncbi:hypothetical protein ACM66T_10160 [Sulfurimonas sp. ST-25]|uniref:hypothetical protein n=1 Tax=Sulfurimonas sp. ST-25 TaxID=3400151 RepID=UPI003A83E460
MRFNYRSYPIDYINELNSKRGLRGRKKSRAFMEYWNDKENGEHNSESFYANSWDVSRSTAHDWVVEFHHECERYVAGMQLKNQQHYSYAVKQTEQTEQKQPSKPSSDKAHDLGVFEEVAEQTEQKQPREDFNKDNNNKSDGEFHYLFFTCQAAAPKNVGNRPAAKEAWEGFSDSNPLGWKDIAAMYLMYVLDKQSHEGFILGLARFLTESKFLAYMNPKVKITDSNGGEHVGYYDMAKNELVGDDNVVKRIAMAVFMGRLQAGAVEYLGEYAAKGA